LWRWWWGGGAKSDSKAFGRLLCKNNLHIENV
jgi:hypothetical protein